MKRYLVSLLLGFLAFAGTALGNPLLLVSGSPNPPGLPYVNITNDTPALYTKGTDFQEVPVGETLRYKIRLQNLGSMVLNYSVSDNSSQFRAIGPGSILVASIGVREFEIEFAPTSTGVKNAVLTISSNDPNNGTFEINLTGTGTAPELDVFGGPLLNVSITDGDTTPRTADGTAFGLLDTFDPPISKFFRLKNNGSSDLQFISASVESGQGFSISSLPVPASFLGEGEGHNFIITFDPSTIGTKTATVTILTDDANEGSYTFDVNGTGTRTPEITMRGRSGTLPLSNINDGSTTPLVINGTAFADTEVGMSSTNLFRIQNDGTAPLEYDITEDSDQFRITSIDGDTLPIGMDGFDSFFILFEPTSPGTKTATIRIDNNDPDEDPFTFLIQGTAVAPEITVLGNDLEIVNGDDTPRVADGTNFLDVLVDGGFETHKFTIKNDGDRILTFLSASITPGIGFFLTDLPDANFPIPARGSVTFNVAFNPTTDGQATAKISIVTTDTDETPYTFDVTGNGIGDPKLRLLNGNQNSEDVVEESQRIDFGESELGEPNTERFVIENIGNGTLDYTVTVSNTEFRIADPGETLEPNQDHIFAIFFEPSSRGDKAAVVTISSNDPEQSPFSFIVEATAIDPEMDLFGGEILNMPIPHLDSTPTSDDGTDFGTVSVNAPGVTKTFRIFNSGEMNLIIAGHNVGGNANFFLTGLPTAIEPIAPNTGETFQITFEPQTAGTHTLSVKITNSDDNENPYTFTITGQGLDGPEFELTGGSGDLPIVNGDTTPRPEDGTDFGIRDIRTSTISTFKITNAGNRNLDLGKASISAGQGFTLGTLPPGQIRAQGELTFDVIFSPTASGATSATVSIPSNDADENPFTFDVAGEGSVVPTDPDIEIRNAAGTLVIPSGDTTPDPADGTDFGTVQVGSGSASQSFTIFNTGGLNLEDISGTGAFIPGLATTVAPGGNDGFTITLPSTTPGLKTATISIASNDPDENPYTFTVQLLVLPNDPPKLTSFTLDGPNGAFVIDTVLGQQYQLTSSATLEGPWTTVPGVPLIDGTGSEVTMEVDDLVTPGTARNFFRIETSTP